MVFATYIQRRNALRNGRENPWGLAEPHLDDSVERSVEVAESARKSWGRDGLGLEGLEERLKLVKRMARLMTFTDSGIFMKSWGIVFMQCQFLFLGLSLRPLFSSHCRCMLQFTCN